MKLDRTGPALEAHQFRDSCFLAGLFGDRPDRLVFRALRPVRRGLPGDMVLAALHEEDLGYRSLWEIISREGGDEDD